MISPELSAKIRLLFYAEHWKVGTIASELGVHPDTVHSAIESNSFRRGPSLRKLVTDPYLEFIQQTLADYPRLRSTRLFEMIRQRGYPGSVVQLRRVVREIRPVKREAFLKLQMLPAEQAQMDWAHFGQIIVGKAKRRLSCFVMVLSYSRAIWLEFFFDQSLENLLLGHVHAFEDWQGVPRICIYDNMRSIVLERLGDAIRFHPRILELSGHYHFAPRPARPARGNEKGRVERTIQYIRHSFFAARRFSTLSDLNNQALVWREEIAHQRRWPEDDNKTVQEMFLEERSRLLPLPVNRFETDLIKPARSAKTIYIRFDLNDYSIPPSFVGRQLTLAASSTCIRILDGTAEVARHQRSYDRGKCISDPAHLDALLKEKRKALGSTAVARLQHAVPNIQEFLQAAADRGEPLSQMSRQLILLLSEYGAGQLAAAVTEALARQTPRVSSVAFILHRCHRAKKLKLPMVDLSHHPLLADISVPDASLEVYDELNHEDDES